MNPIPPPPPLYFTYKNTHAYSLTKWLLVVFDECMWHWIFDDIIFFFLYVWIPNFCVCVHYKVVQSTMYLFFYPISTRTCIWINLWHVYHAGFFLYIRVYFKYRWNKLQVKFILCQNYTSYKFCISLKNFRSTVVSFSVMWKRGSHNFLSKFLCSFYKKKKLKSIIGINRIRNMHKNLNLHKNMFHWTRELEAHNFITICIF